MNKELYMIFDLFNIDYDNKKVVTKLYEIIAERIKNSEEYMIEDLSLKMRNYLIQEINELPFEFIMKDEIDTIDLLKAFNLKIDEANYTTILERLELVIDLITTLKLATVLILPNLKMYLKEEDLLELYKYSLYNNVKLLLIERGISQNKLKYEEVYQINNQFEERLL